MGAADHQRIWPVDHAGWVPQRRTADCRRYRNGSLGSPFGQDERTYLACRCSLIAAAVGLALAGSAGSWVSVVAALTLVNVGISSAKPPLWAMPTMFLSGSAAAAGIATINSIGNLGGFAGPAMIGWIKDTTGSFLGGLYFVSGLLVVSAVLTLVLSRSKRTAPTSAQPQVDH